MKIAIYGDSFAARHQNNKPTNNEYWFDILATMLNVEIDVFARPASSTFYSYKKFLKNYKNYDINIFFVTSPFRYTKSYIVPFIGERRVKEYFIYGVDAIDQIIRENDLKNKQINDLDAISKWFIASDDEFMECTQSLIVKDIVHKDNNVILFPCFKDSISIETAISIGRNFKVCMQDYMTLIWEYFGMDVKEGYVETQNMYCHMTEELNVIFAQSLYDYIKTGKEITLPDKIEIKNSREHYFEKR